MLQATEQGVEVVELPSGTVTFLFTDIEGSTRLWQEQPEAMRPALARHDEILRAAIEAHGGHYVKTTGDGAHAVFATAADGIDAAVAAQVAIGLEEWPLPAPLRVRMGLHSGPAELRDGDYYGTTVNRAARIMSVAHGGQVVLSLAAQELARDGGREVLDLGEHRLKDLGQPERIFQVVDPALDGEFPPLRSLDTFTSNLPTQLTSFVGRDDELAGVAKALDERRLVTLTGTGGVGKTRLSVQVAAEVLPRFGDGAWFCELATAADGETMAQLVAAELGVAQRSGMSLEASISDYLRPKVLLLVLDNCEHLLSAVGALAGRVLRECPGVRILATSREGLAVSGEQVWPLPSLPLPDPSDAPATTAANDAVVLFVERATAARATFALDAANAGAVAEICRRLDGIPLAIELAAARVVSMAPVEIKELLDERFRLLTGGRRTSVERHQTLRATVDWSYSLLGEQEQAVFDRLGVFAGTFDTRAAQAVVTGDDLESWDVLDALAELVGKSMVVAEDTAQSTTRFRMLETLRQYARERLDEHGEIDRWRRRHAEYFVAWAEEAGRGLEGPDEVAWRTRENAELDNLRASVTWALDGDDADDIGLALGIVAALCEEAQTNPAAGVGLWAEWALPFVGDASPQVRYAVTAASAMYLMTLGRYEDAVARAERAIADGVPSESPSPTSAFVALGQSLLVLGQPERAIATLREGAQLADRDYPGSIQPTRGHVWFAGILAQVGDPLARAETGIALRMAREVGNPSSLANALMGYGWAVLAEDPVAALAAFDERIALGHQGASPIGTAATLCLAAGVRARSGDLAGAARDLRESVESSHQNGTRLSFYVGTLWGIYVFTARERFDQAAVLDGIASSFLTTDYRARWARVDVSDAIDRARAGLGSDRYDEAIRTGARMPYDQAIGYTLRALDDLLAEFDTPGP